MKTTNLLKKNSKIVNAHNKRVRHNGTVWRIISQSLGAITLADAEPVTGGQRVNLFARTKTAQDLRNVVELGLFV